MKRVTIKRVIAVGSLLILLVTGVTLCLTYFSSYGQIKGYIYPKGNVTCLAVSPECGYCPGEIRDEKCYITKDTPDRYKE